MNRIKTEHVATALALTLIAVAVVPIIHAQSTDIPRYTMNIGEVDPNKFAVTVADPDGQLVLYSDVEAALANCGGTGATSIWYPLPLVPEQDERLLFCQIKPGEFYALRNYTNGQWRNGTSVTPPPVAWARINARIEE